MEWMVPTVVVDFGCTSAVNGTKGGVTAVVAEGTFSANNATLEGHSAPKRMR